MIGHRERLERERRRRGAEPRARGRPWPPCRQVFEDGELEYKEISPTSLMVELPGEKKLQTPVPLRRRPARAGGARVRVPQARRELRGRLPVAAGAEHEDVRRLLRPRRHGRHLPRRPAPARRRDDRGDRPAARRGAGVLRRVVQHDPRARVRLLDPQGVGVADLARRADPQPRGVPGAARARRAGDAGGRRADGPLSRVAAQTRPSGLRRQRSGVGPVGSAAGLRRATATPTRASAPPAYAIVGRGLGRGTPRPSRS